MLVPGLLEVDRVVQLLLHLKGLKELLQVRNEVDDGREDKDGDENSTGPVLRSEVAVSDGAHGDHEEVVGLKEGEVVTSVDAKEVVKKTCPVGASGGREGGRERERVSVRERERERECVVCVCVCV